MKHPLAWNLILALIWTTLTARFTPGNFILGLGIGYLAILLADPAPLPGRYGRRLATVTRFAVFYLWEIAASSLRVAYDVLTPRLRARPALVAVPLRSRTPAEVTTVANLLTMTPGSLSVDVSDDGTILYVHSMYVKDVESFRTHVRDDFERRVLEVTR